MSIFYSALVESDFFDYRNNETKGIRRETAENKTFFNLENLKLLNKVLKNWSIISSWFKKFQGVKSIIYGIESHFEVTLIPLIFSLTIFKIEVFPLPIYHLMK